MIGKSLKYDFNCNSNLKFKYDLRHVMVTAFWYISAIHYNSAIRPGFCWTLKYFKMLLFIV